MYLLDTDHLSEIIAGRSAGKRLERRLAEVDEFETVATSIVSFDESLRGWLAKIHGTPNPRDQIESYEALFRVLAAFQNWIVLRWGDEDVDVYDGLLKQRLRVRTMDLKIAAIAIQNDATLLSRNLKDFVRVPGLVVEDWLS